MSEAARPRPRPRPRPKAKAPESAPKSPTPAPASASSTCQTTQATSSTVLNVVDSDEMFMKNRSRSLNTWRKWDKLDRENATPQPSAEAGSDDDSSPKSQKHKKKKVDYTDGRKWQPEEKLRRLLSEEPSDDLGDSDDEIQILSVKSSSTAHGQRKRKRSRSRSITPPPAPEQTQVLLARSAVDRALRANGRAQSPIELSDDDDDNTEITLDPELAKIAQSVKKSQQSHQPLPTATSETINISVTWLPHPLDPSKKSENWVYKLYRDDNFSDLFEAIADDAHISVQNLIVQYNGKRLFSSVTPAALRIWVEAEFTACDKITMEYLRVNPLESPPPAQEADPIPGPSGYTAIDTPPTSQPDPPSEAESEDGDKFRLTLRSQIVQKDIHLTVRPTTKCGAIVKAYLKKAGLADQYSDFVASATSTASKGKKKGAPQKNPQLSLDGDRLSNDAEIGEADLEDGDLVEVVGL